MSENVKGIQSSTLICTESCDFTWSIENFNLCGLQGEEYMNSPIFSTGQPSLTTWSLRLYPNKDNTAEKDGNVGIKLLRTTTDSSAHYANLKFSIICSDSKRYSKTDGFCLYNEIKYIWGYENFISRKTLFGSERSSYLPQDKLTIMCEIKTTRVDDYKASELTDSSAPITPSAFKKPESLKNDLQHLFNSNMYSDLTITVGDEVFNAHKLILSARSTVFNTMLNCDMKEKLTSCVTITDFDPPTVKMMLHYIYCGQVEDLNSDISIQLYSAAEKYNLQDLKDVCVEYLSGNLSVDNFCDVLTLGELHNEQGLMILTKNFFIANASIIRKTEKWLGLSKTNPDLVFAMHEVIFSKLKI